MAKPKVAIARNTPGLDKSSVFKDCDVWMWEKDAVCPTSELMKHVSDIEGLFVTSFDPVQAAMIAAAPKLKVISHFGAGVDAVDVKAASARKIPVGNTPGVVTEDTADFAMALMLSMMRNVVPAANWVKAKQWKEWTPTLHVSSNVFGKTLGIIGMGRIGSAIAKRAQGFSMNMLYYARNRRPDAEKAYGVQYRSFDDLLKESDVIILICPLTPETRHMINDAAFAKMKPTAMLVNSARGGVVEPKALYKALSTKKIHAAAIDVTEPEPILPDDPLLTLDNLIITPHISTSTWETRTKMTEITLVNLMNGLAGKPLMHCVNPDVYGK
ncbi:MAG TPA: D-glycerate dehydrogenase [bacterium]